MAKGKTGSAAQSEEREGRSAAGVKPWRTGRDSKEEQHGKE